MDTDFRSIYYLESKIWLTTDSVTSGFIRLHGDLITKEPIFRLNMNNKLDDGYYLSLLKENKRPVKVHEFAAMISIPGIEEIIGYVNDSSFQLLESSKIAKIEITNIVELYQVGYFIPNMLTGDNQFWLNSPTEKCKIRGCGYSFCGYQIFDFSTTPSEELLCLIDELNIEQEKCHRPINETPTNQEIESWWLRMKEIIKYDSILVLGNQCNG